MPRALPVLTVAALAVALVGCSSGEPDNASTPDTDTTAQQCVASGAQSDAVKVSGELGSAPTVSFDTPMTVDATQRTVTTAGSGDEVEADSTITMQYSLYSGTTGEVLAQTDYTAAASTLTLGGLIPGLESTLLCTPAESRVVGVVAPDDAFGADGSDSLGVAADETLVFVIDVVSIVPTAADAMIPWTDDVPTVSRAADGTPTVTLPDTDPPADLMLTVLTEGDGAVVADGDSVTVDYQGTSWDTGEIFDQSFGKTPATFATNQVVAGFGAALVGQKVGSTVLVTIPPIYGYGTDPSAAQLGGQTLVFLIDIKATAAQ